MFQGIKNFFGLGKNQDSSGIIPSNANLNNSIPDLLDNLECAKNDQDPLNKNSKFLLYFDQAKTLGCTDDEALKFAAYLTFDKKIIIKN
jgi:hypothetical protein